MKYNVLQVWKRPQRGSNSLDLFLFIYYFQQFVVSKSLQYTLFYNFLICLFNRCN